MTNNDILKKLRIALSLKDFEIIEILKLVDFEMTKTELSALFRKDDHPNYKECGDQVLRKFLNGLIIKNRGTREERAAKAASAPEAKKTFNKNTKPKAKPNAPRGKKQYTKGPKKTS
ncbi:DUF1456 family protein [Halobacteriovorax sp. HFRX-2_2]|uniref:DUF1456 family protein n=1 Tax=unclassified Halobacteriovorax TaxID=2639665 RepID=UPI003721E223